MFTIWGRNAMLVQWTIAIAVACVLLVPRLAAYVFGIWPMAGDVRWLSVGLFIVSIAGIAGNLQQVSTAKPNSWRKRLLQKELAWAGLGLAAGFGAAAWILSVAGFDPFGPGPVNPWIALFVAGFLVAGGYCLLPAAVAVYDRFPKPEYTEVNYGQTHVQWFIVVPLLVCSFFFGAILWDLSENGLGSRTTYGALFLGAWRDWPFPLSVVFVSLWGLAFCSIEQWKVKGPAVALIAAVGSVVALHALLCAIVLLLQPWSIESTAHAFVAAPVMVLYAFSMTIIVLIGLVGRQSLEGVREWWSRLGAWLNHLRRGVGDCDGRRGVRSAAGLPGVPRALLGVAVVGRGVGRHHPGRAGGGPLRADGSRRDREGAESSPRARRVRRALPVHCGPADRRRHPPRPDHPDQHWRPDVARPAPG
jgi:hypothetical protein